MSEVVASRKTRADRRQRSIFQVHYSLQRRVDMARPLPLPNQQITAYSRQVAGHMHTSDEKYLGVLQCNDGTILKPIIKESQKREVDLYNRLSTTTNKDLLELRSFTPAYYGCRKFTYNGHEMEYIVLEDLVERMLEPCIMDVKIGKRTYDPLASPEKIARESSKYSACKQQYGFCIPGFQVWRLPEGRLVRHGKEYGKRLEGDMVVAAIRTFLNCSAGGAPCRSLVLRMVSQLWRVQRWAQRQRGVRLYGGSLLLAYDAAALRHCCGGTTHKSSKCGRVASVCRSSSIHSSGSPVSGSDFSGQISAKGPIYKKVGSVPITAMTLAQTTFGPQPTESPWRDVVEQLSHNHSFDHNYEEELSKIKLNYRALLDQLSEDSPSQNEWASVKLIDFAHAFFNEDDEMAIDDNFREGIDNFVAIFERFLKETDDVI